MTSLQEDADDDGTVDTGESNPTLTYDGNGNLTTDEAGRTVVYDAWNHLIKVTSADGSRHPEINAYDATGFRVRTITITVVPGSYTFRDDRSL